MKYFFLSIWTIVTFIHALVDAQGDPRFDPFLLSLDANSPRFLELPSTDIPSLKDKDAMRKIIAACPAESTAKKIMRKISIKTQYCLFQKSYTPNQTASCSEEVKPMLHTQYDDITHKPINCGTSEDHIMYEFGFYYCGTGDVITQLSDRKRKKTPQKYFKPRFFPIYELCIDLLNETAIWTRHNIMTPAMFQAKNNTKKLPLETGQDPVEISVDNLPQMNDFAELRKRFNKKQKTKKPQMKATFMVPMEHIALRTWRKAANHYINVAPFWVSKNKLMLGINDGIKKIAFALHSQNRRLSIYTSVRELTRKGAGYTWSHIQTKPYIWSKLLYEEESKLAAMVVIHGDYKDPTKPPTTRVCDKPFDFKSLPNWYEMREGDVEGIPPNDLAFAYFCDPSTLDVERLFNMYLEINGILDIDRYFHEGNQGNQGNQGNSNNPQMAVPFMAPGNSNYPPPVMPPTALPPDGIPIAVPYVAPHLDNHSSKPSAPPAPSDSDSPPGTPYPATSSNTSTKPLPTPPLGYPPIMDQPKKEKKAKNTSLSELLHTNEGR